jgi:hypothetical protein
MAAGQQYVPLKGLPHVVICASLQAPVLCFAIADGGQNHDRYVAGLAQKTQHLPTVHAR